MRFTPHENSLFARLLRSPWWVSVLVALGVVALLRLVLPTPYAVAGGVPFLVIGAVAGWRQLHAPSEKRIARTLERVGALSWEEFAGALEEAYRRAGYSVTRLALAHADFELARGAHKTLVACKRWKAARTGVEPLRELQALRRKREADDCIYIAAGEITESARAFAAKEGIRLVQGAELAQLLA